MFPACRSSHILCLAANEKDFSLSLEMTNAGKRYFRIVSLLHEESVRRYSPSFPWKEVPQRGGGWLSQRTESCAGERHSRIVIPSGAEGSFSFAVFLFLCGTVCMKHRFWGRREYGVSRLPFLSHPLPCRERKRFLTFARNDECGEAPFSYRKPSVWGVCEAAFSLLPMEGGGPKGRRLASERDESHGRRSVFPSHPFPSML